MFLVHFVISVIFFILGWVSIGFSNGYGTELSLVERMTIPIGIVIMITAFLSLFKKSFGVYLGIFAITLTAILVWMMKEAAMDMQWVLLIYMLIMTPVLIIMMGKKNALHQK